MAEKAAKGQKIGRGSRAPTTAMQARRTERNKRESLEKNPAGARGINRDAGKSQYRHGQPVRPGRLPSLANLHEAKTVRVVAVMEAKNLDPFHASNFRLEFSEKLAKAVAKKRGVSVKDFELARKFREKHASH